MVKSNHKITYTPFGTSEGTEVEIAGKTETKRIALGLIRDGHSNVIIHTQAPTGDYFGDAELNREVIDAHKARMSRSLAPYIALRKLATVIDSLASVAKTKDLTEEQKARLAMALFTVLPAIGVPMPDLSQIAATLLPTNDAPLSEIDPFVPEISQESAIPTPVLDIAETPPIEEVNTVEEPEKRTRSFLRNR